MLQSSNLKGEIMQVYIELVFIDNLIIDYLLLKYTFLLTKSRSGFWQLLFCAVLGASFATLLPVIKLNILLITLIKLTFSLCLVYVGARFYNLKSYLLSVLVFNMYTFLLGGGIISIFNLLCLPYNKDYSVGIILGIFYVLIKIIHKIILIIYKRKNIYAYLSDCELSLGNVTVKATGFLDTGNRLYDNQTQCPVVICSKKVAFELTDNLKNKINARYIKITTAIGEDKILVFKIDNLKIYNKDKPNIFNNIMLGVSKKPFVEGEYDLILHSELGGIRC